MQARCKQVSWVWARPPLEAQKQFLANTKDSISFPVDLHSEICRYQDVLRYVGSEVKYIFGIILYMVPGDMFLFEGHVVGYNNEIMIATLAQNLGIKTNVKVTSTSHNSVNNTGETGLVNVAVDSANNNMKCNDTNDTVAHQPDTEKQALADIHVNEKNSPHCEQDCGWPRGTLASFILVLVSQ